MTSSIVPDAFPAEVYGMPGVTIREVSSLPDHLEGGVPCGGWSTARPGALLHTVPGVAKFLITDGDLIQLQREKGVETAAVELYLVGAARAALVHQRGGLPLHAACVVPPGRDFAVAIAGPSGAGKSTLAAELVANGWTLLGDDMTPLSVQDDRVFAWPSRPAVKLWQDSCERLQIDTTHLRAVPGHAHKFFRPVSGATAPKRLQYLCILQAGEPEGIVSLRGTTLLAHVASQTYKLNYVRALGCEQSHLRVATRIAASSSVFRLKAAFSARAHELSAHIDR